MADSLVIRITGDDTELQHTLSRVSDSVAGVGADASAALAGAAVLGAAIEAGMNAASLSAIACASEVDAVKEALEQLVHSGELMQTAMNLTELILQPMGGLLGEAQRSEALEAGGGLAEAAAEGLRNGGTALQRAGMELSRIAASGVGAGSAAMRSAGTMAAEGFRTGMLLRRSAVIAAARGIALAAAAAMREALEIRSPSRVTMRMGDQFGEGFRLGAEASLRQAVRSAEQIVGEINLAGRIAEPAVQAASGSAGPAAEAQRPIYLQVNGRTLARVIGRDLQRQAGAEERSVAMGYGG